MKKLFSILLIACMTVSLVACNKDNADENDVKVNAVPGIPTYEDNCQLEIGAYSGPAKADYDYWDPDLGISDPVREGFASNINKKEFQSYKDAGFTFMLTEYNADYDSSPTRNFTESDLYPTMELAEELGIGILVNTSTLTMLTSSADYRLTDDAKEYLQKLVNNLRNYKCFKGFSLRDEPKMEFAHTIGTVSEYLKSLKPDAMFFTSMLPIYGSNAITFDMADHQEDATTLYGQYIDKYLNAINQFDYDFYPLWYDATQKRNYLDTQWYQNLEMVARKVKEKPGAKMGITIQSGSWGKPGMRDIETHKRSVTSKADIGFQAYSALAYGAKTLSYFTYWLHWGGTENEVFYDSMVMPPEVSGGEGVKTDCYYAVQAVNQELKKFDHVLMNFDWQGTVAVTAGKNLKSGLLGGVVDYTNPRIKKATATEESIIGCFKDKNGYDGFMIVNSTEPSENKADEVTVTFREATKALCYINGEEQTIDLKNGEYTFKLNAGEGIFCIPIV